MSRLSRDSEPTCNKPWVTSCPTSIIHVESWSPVIGMEFKTFNHRFGMSIDKNKVVLHCLLNCLVVLLGCGGSWERTGVADVVVGDIWRVPSRYSLSNGAEHFHCFNSEHDPIRECWLSARPAVGWHLSASPVLTCFQSNLSTIRRTLEKKGKLQLWGLKLEIGRIFLKAESH